MLLERERELTSLWAVVEAARAQRGALVIIEGEAGIGKTSLLEETGARASDAGLRVLRARGTILEREFGFGIVRQLFERDVLAAGQDEQDAVLAGAAALASSAIGLAPQEEQSAERSVFAVQHGLFWLSCNLAERQPVVLLVDDAQWADLPSLRWLNYLSRRLDGVALAVLVAWRTGEADAPTKLLETLRQEAAAGTLSPEALSEQASATIIGEAVGDDAAPQFRRACHETTGGNPFLLRAVVEAVLGGLIMPTEQGAVDIRKLGPAAVQRSLLQRISRLGDDAHALARAVSVLDSDAEPRFAYAVADLDVADGLQAATALERARILNVGDELRFAHPILRAAVYEDLSLAERALHHRRVADTLERDGGDPDRGVVHLMSSQPGADPRVVERLSAAARRAMTRGTPEMGLALLERALTEPPAPDDRPAVHLEAGRMALALAHPEAKTHLTEAFFTAKDPALRARAAAELARAIFHARPVEASTVLRDALDGLPHEGSELADRLRLELLTIESTGELRSPAAVEHDIRRLHTTAPAGSPTRMAATCLLLWHLENWDEHPNAERVAELAKELTDVRPLIAAYGPGFMPLAWAASVLAEWDELDVAEATLVAVLDAARRTGDAFGFSLGASCRGIHLAWCGRFDEAEADARASLRTATATGSWTGRRGAVMALVWALTGRGDHEAANAALTSHGLEHATGSSVAVDANLLLARAILRGAEHRIDDARDDIDRCLEITKHRNPLNRMNVWAPRVLAMTGQTERALELARTSVSAARTSGLIGPLGVALHSAGLAQQSTLAIQTLTEAAEVLSRSPWRWEHAEALVDLGAALRRANQRVDARTPLSSGLALAEQIGAQALAERALAELLATGARPRRTLVRGADSLTASERRVAALAAEGLTISEVAQALFVTRKTIETHLYGAYRKLGINSRDELGSALSQN